MNSKLTKFAYLAGAVYFLLMAIAHFFGIKVPVLFIYFDTPFYAYQDKIISFAVCAYIALFCLAYKRRENTPAAIVVMLLTALGLSAVNVSGDLAEILEDGQTTAPYWIQTVIIYVYAGLLSVLYLKDGRIVE